MVVFLHIMIQVYPMTAPVRGRALIINIKEFRGDGEIIPESTRDGSEFDYHNLEKLFCGLGFSVVGHPTESTNLTAEVIFILLYKTRWKTDTFVNRF